MNKFIILLALAFFLISNTCAIEIHGATRMTGQIDMNTNKITEVANGTADQDAATHSQLVGRSGGVVLVGPYTHDDFVVDGTNDHVQINQATAYAMSHKKSVVLLENFAYDISGKITTFTNITLRGNTWPKNLAVWSGSEAGQFANFSIDFATEEAIELGTGAALIGIEFYYPNNPLSGGAPVYHPATILIRDAVLGAEVAYCHPKNPYYFVNESGHLTAANVYHDIYGYFTKRGIFVHDSIGGSEIRNVQFLPTFAGLRLDNLDIYNYVAEHGVAIEYDRGDSCRVDNCQFWEIGYGIVINSTNAQKFQGGIIKDCLFDVVPHPIKGTWAQYVHIENVDMWAVLGTWIGGVYTITAESNFMGLELSDCNGVKISGGNWGASAYAVNAHRSNLTIDHLGINGWGQAAPCAGIMIQDCNHANGYNIISGCSFASPGAISSAIQVINCNNFTIMGNTGNAGTNSITIHGADCKDYVILGNNIWSASGLYNEATGAARQEVAHNLL